MNAYLQHRPATATDLGDVVGFPQNIDELFFCYPKAIWPRNVGQLAAAIAERHESTVVELDGKVAGFAISTNSNTASNAGGLLLYTCLLYTSPSPRDS